jgi:hypothetical protein
VFQGVVALEDYIREIGNGLGQIETLDTIGGVNHIKSLKVKINEKTEDPFLSREKQGPFLNPNKLNTNYKNTLGIEPITKDNRLKDLIILRHIVAHNASYLRQIDVKRFQYYRAEANHIFKPNEQFARETLGYLGKVVSGFQKTVLDRILELLKINYTREQFLSSCLVKEIITLFEYPHAQANKSSEIEKQEFTILTKEEELEIFNRRRDELASSSVKNLSHFLYGVS